MRLNRLPTAFSVLKPLAPVIRRDLARCLHTSKQSVARPIPPPIPTVPDVSTFLRVIGRDMAQYESKFPTWEALFTLTSPQLRELGIEPARSRKYLLQWLERYRRGDYGPGGDFQYVEDGKAVLGIDHNLVNGAKRVVNIPHDVSIAVNPEAPKAIVRGYRVVGGTTIAGPYALPSGKETALVSVVDRMWEFRRGQKVDGGERRRTEIRFKRRNAERKAAREAEFGTG